MFSISYLEIERETEKALAVYIQPKNHCYPAKLLWIPKSVILKIDEPTRVYPDSETCLIKNRGYIWVKDWFAGVNQIWNYDESK